MPKLPPGPRLPRLAQSYEWGIRPVQFMEKCAERYGDLFTVRLPAAAGGTFVFVTRPDDVNQVLKTDAKIVHAGEGNKMLEPVLGPNSILVLDEAQHIRQRRLILPAFHGERISAYDAVITEVAEHELDKWPTGESFEAHSYMKNITLEVIMRTVFGFEDERIPELWKRFSDVLDLNSGRMMMLMIPAMQRSFFGRGPWANFERTVASLEAAILDEVERSRAAGDFEERGDVMSLLLSAVDEDGMPMSDAELRDELISLLVVGHESTATALSWALERLAHTPRAYERLKESVDAGEDEYLEAVCKETLRSRTVLPLVARKLTAPLTIRDTELPAGVIAAPCLHMLHNRKDVYGDPENFRPERWLEDDIDPRAWVPFASGVRRCVGASFAMHEMMGVLRVVARRFDIEPATTPPEPVVRRTVVFAPEHDATLAVARRSTYTTPETREKDAIPAAGAS